MCFRLACWNYKSVGFSVIVTTLAVLRADFSFGHQAIGDAKTQPQTPKESTVMHFAKNLRKRDPEAVPWTAIVLLLADGVIFIYVLAYVLKAVYLKRFVLGTQVFCVVIEVYFREVIIYGRL